MRGLVLLVLRVLVFGALGLGPPPEERGQFVFFAGLGGTGHHFWQAVLRTCPFCSDAHDARLALHDWWYHQHTTQDDQTWRRKVARLLSATAEAQNSTLWCLNVLAESGTGVMSYPNAASRNFMPHVDWLADAAREANVRLTIVVLLRDAAALEASVDRRFHGSFQANWGGAHPVADAMTVQAVALQRQLGMLPSPSIQACLTYETLPTISAEVDRLCEPRCAEWSFSSAAKKVFIPANTRAGAAKKAHAPANVRSELNASSYLYPLHEANWRLMRKCDIEPAAGGGLTGGPG